jgi:alpha-beta hydrolase superfamily lysophospholipase
MSACRRLSSFLVGWLVLWAAVTPRGSGPPQTREMLTIRGHTQIVSMYGRRGGRPVVVSSGDGGWIHLAPHVAEFLASQGFFVVGFDTRGYLESFTAGRTTLAPQDEPGDYKALADFAAQGSTAKPVLIGVSEGAGLSLLAATDPATRQAIGGVIGLGLPDINELGWRWKDAIIYVTHGVPDGPTRGARRSRQSGAARRHSLDARRVRAALRRDRRRPRTQAALGR